jgi:glycolate oxidase
VGLNRFEEAMLKMYGLFDSMKLTAGVIGSMVDRRTVMMMPYYLDEIEEEGGNFMEFHKNLEKTANELDGRRVGLGLYFSSCLSNIHDRGSISLMHAIKNSIDPDNLMNPGKVICKEDLLED